LIRWKQDFTGSRRALFRRRYFRLLAGDDVDAALDALGFGGVAGFL